MSGSAVLTVIGVPSAAFPPAYRLKTARWCHQMKYEGSAAGLATLTARDIAGQPANVKDFHPPVSGRPGYPCRTGRCCR